MKMGYVLAAAVALAGAVAFFGTGTRGPTAPTPPARPEPPATSAPEAPAAPSRRFVEGTALEVRDVPGYTYLRIGQAGSEGEWTAVGTARVSVGSPVRVRVETEMHDFESRTLGRRFERIAFGVLEGGPSPAAAGSAPAAAATASAGPGAPAAAPSAARATGENAHTVSELWARKGELAGKKVRVRGLIVKLTPGVLGKTFLHLKDGTGSAAKKDDDLTVTTAEPVQKDQTLTFEGTLVTDRDLGSGYRYEVMLEDAVVVR
jgi:hypothetical protein